MTHPERTRPIRDRRGPRGPAAPIPRARTLPAQRLAELDRLAALFAEAHGDTPEVTAVRRRVLDSGASAHSGQHAWDRAIAAALREIRGAA